jgi:transcriptional regulator with XRE-family HTH domain
VPRKVRSHIDLKADPPVALTPKHLTRQEFARRLYKLMISKGWHQSELARRAGVPRDAVSTYVRGTAMPTPLNLDKLAKALGTTAEELLPNIIESAIDEDSPSIDFKVSPSAPNTAWLRVNRLVSLTTGAKIIELLEADDVGKSRTPANGE